MIICGSIIENSAVVLLARVRDADGIFPVSTEVETLTCKVWNSESAERVGTVPLTVGDCVLDALVTDDARWTADSTGYNFAAVIPGSYFPDGDTRYQVEIKVTFNTEYVDREPFYLVWKLDTENIFSE